MPNIVLYYISKKKLTPALLGLSLYYFIFYILNIGTNYFIPRIVLECFTVYIRSAPTFAQNSLNQSVL